MSLGAGVSLLQGTQLRIARADGTAISTPTGYTYNATLQDSYSRATYPFISSANPYGNGYALDVGAKIVWAKSARIDLAINDLLGKMTWHNIPNTIEMANSQTLARDAAGYIYYNPTISGVNDINRRTVVQKLASKAHSRFTYQLPTFSLFAGTSWMRGYWFPELGASWRMSTDWESSLDYDSRFKTLGLGIQNKWGRFGVRSSSTSMSNAKAYGINAAFCIPI